MQGHQGKAGELAPQPAQVSPSHSMALIKHHLQCSLPARCPSIPKALPPVTWAPDLIRKEALKKNPFQRVGIPQQKLSDAGNKDLLFLGTEIDC